MSGALDLAGDGVRAVLGDKAKDLQDNLKEKAQRVSGTSTHSPERALSETPLYLSFLDRMKIADQLSNHRLFDAATPRMWESILELPLEPAHELLKQLEATLATKDGWSTMLADAHGLLQLLLLELDWLARNEGQRAAAQMPQSLERVAEKELLGHTRSTLSRFKGAMVRLVEAHDRYSEP